MYHISAAVLFVGLFVGASSGSPPGGLFSNLGRPYSLSAERIRVINNAVGRILLKMSDVSPDDVSVRSERETYLLVVRQYYKSVLQTRDTALRCAILLRADRLWRRYAAFTALVQKALSRPGTSDAARHALRKFQKASMNLDMPIDSWSALTHFQNRLLGPLAPLATMPASAADTVVWPVAPHRSVVLKVAASPSNVPPISQTIASLPGVNITAKMRRVFASVLRQIESEMQRSPPDRQAERYYRIILRCLALSEHLQQASVLSLAVQQSFNHRLMLALLFFKDPRTRSGAVRRLEFIGRVVNTMELISAAPISSADKQVLDARVRRIMTNLDQHLQTSRYVRQLNAIRAFLRAALKIRAGGPSSAPFGLAQNRIIATGEKTISSSVASLQNKVSVHQLHTAELQLRAIGANLKRIQSLPGELEQALLYHPRSPGGVRRNLARWARQIEMSPAIDSDASRQCDRFGRALQLLAQIHLQLLHLAPTHLLDELAAHRYVKLVGEFHRTQREVINSLSTPRPAPESVVAQLRRQMHLLKTVHRLGDLVADKNNFVKLNLWAPWHLNRAARHLWIHQMMEAVAHEFQRDTGLKSSSDAWLSFRSAAPAIKTLYRAVKLITPKLHADRKLWSTTYFQAMLPPPSDALAGGASIDFTQACMMLTSAAANQAHGHFQSATQIFRRANRVLAAIALPKPA
jgi:hypothetical protein